MPNDSPILDPDDLDGHVVWLRRLAFSLVRDAHAADDIAQETWLKAIERRPESGVSLRAWLTTVARNFARLRHRRSSRRGPETSFEEGDGGAPPTVDVVARAEGARRLVGAVLALDEPYRTTVLLRYAERLSSAEIARRTGVPEGTVRWRLKRGIDTLRVVLDDRGDRGERALGALVAPFALRHPLVPVSIAAGGALMTLKTVCVVAATLVLLGTAAWFVAFPGSEPPNVVERPLVAPAVAKDRPFAIGRGGAVAAEEPEAVVRETASTEERPAAAVAETVVRVVDERERPISGAKITLAAPRDERNDDQLVLTSTAVTTGEDGTAVLPIGLDEDVLVYVDHEAYAPQITSLRKGRVPVVVLRRAAALFGTVRTFETLAPIVGARVTIGTWTTGPDSPLETLTDREGRYRIERVGAGADVSVLVRRREHVTHQQEAHLEAAVDTRLDIAVPEGRTFRGVVIDSETRAPMADVEVYGGDHVRTDDEGRFEVRGLVEETPVFELRAPGYCMTQLIPQRESIDERTEVVFPMFRGCDVGGVVMNFAGRPLGGMRIWFSRSHPAEGSPLVSVVAPEFETVGMRISAARGAWYATDVTTDTEGRFLVRGLSPGMRFRIEALSPDSSLRLLSSEISLSRSGERHEVELIEPRLGAIEGLIGGSPTAHSTIRWEGPSSYGYVVGNFGEYRIEGVEAGLVRLQLSGGLGLLTEETVIVTEGETTRHDFVTMSRTTPIAGVVRTLGGEPVSGVIVFLCPVGTPSIGCRTTDAGGEFRFEIPGATRGSEYVLEYSGELFHQIHMKSPPIHAGDEDVVLVFPRTATPTLRIVDADTGIPLPRVVVSWRLVDGERTLAPEYPSVWRPGLHGTAPLRLPIGNPTLILDATLLGYPVTEVESFEVVEGDGVREIRLQRPR